jgi:predicted PurR-regulated permease PerM
MLRWALLIAFVVVGYRVFSTLAGLLSPIVVALGIAYLLDPVLEKMVARGLSRAASATLLLVAFLGSVVGLATVLVPVAISEVEHFVRELPHMVENTTRWVGERTGVDVPETYLVQQSSPDGQLPSWKGYLESDEFRGMVDQGIGPARALVAAALGGVFSILGFLAELLLVPVFAYYFLLDWPNLTGRVRRLIPPRRRGKVLEVLGEIDGVVSGWVRGQAIVTSSLAVLYAIAFSIVGIHLAIPIGLVVGALTVIPFVGTLVGSVIVYAVTLLDWQGVEPVIGVTVVIVVLHLLEAMVLTPKIVGHKVGLSESAALMAVVAGGKLLGFVGVLLAVPLAATLAVLLRHAVRSYERSTFFGREDDEVVRVTGAMATILPDPATPGARTRRGTEPPDGGQGEGVEG